MHRRWTRAWSASIVALGPGARVRAPWWGPGWSPLEAPAPGRHLRKLSQYETLWTQKISLNFKVPKGLRRTEQRSLPFWTLVDPGDFVHKAAKGAFLWTEVYNYWQPNWSAAWCYIIEFIRNVHGSTSRCLNRKQNVVLILKWICGKCLPKVQEINNSTGLNICI